MYQWIVCLLTLVSFTTFGNTEKQVYRFGDHFKYGCYRQTNPSIVPFLRYYAPHVLHYGVDIDFVAARTGICTAVIVALIEQQSGLIRQHTKHNKPWQKPFGYLSEKSGFIAQLIDVSIKLRKLKELSNRGMLSAHDPLAYLFANVTPAATSEQMWPQARRQRFQTLYRDMFMVEYNGGNWQTHQTFDLTDEAILWGWQFRPELV